MLHSCLLLCILLSVYTHAMIPSLHSDVIEHIIGENVSLLDYDDIPQTNLINKQWHTAVTNSIETRKSFISKQLFLDMPNQNAWVWNKLGTACCFVDIARNDKWPHEQYPALFRVQLNKKNLDNSKTIAIFHKRICNSKINQYIVQGNGPTKHYIFSPKSKYPLTCFVPFFNEKGEATVYTSKPTEKECPIESYSLNSKGKYTHRLCFIKKDNGVITTLCIQNDLSHIIAFQCATIEDSANFTTFIFDDAAKKRMEQAPEILALIKQSAEQKI